MITPILNKPSRALVVFSGGQDSTTCLFWAKKHFTEVYALSFVWRNRQTLWGGCTDANPKLLLNDT